MRTIERIQFHYQEIKVPLKDKKTIREWIVGAITREGKKTGDIDYIFCTDEILLKLNQEYLQHDDYTDVITFDYTDENRVSGDIFISYERIVENATELNIATEDELKRVMIHGVLHLCGYKDKNPVDKKRMTEKENEHLAFHPGA
ncbi:MAG: rRNA maturation RNase YbeY [Bacteroidetes bacterium]|nr:rRNA maturation RNase YbeY [Bacteroidota bacterium]